MALLLQVLTDVQRAIREGLMRGKTDWAPFRTEITNNDNKRARALLVPEQGHDVTQDEAAHRVHVHERVEKHGVAPPQHSEKQNGADTCTCSCRRC
jgi:hypothetical protein